MPQHTVRNEKSRLIGGLAQERHCPTRCSQKTDVRYLHFVSSTVKSNRETHTKKSDITSFSSCVSRSLGSTLAALKWIHEISPSSSTFSNVLWKDSVSRISWLNVKTSTSLPTAFADCRTASRSLCRRALSLERRAILLNLRLAKIEAVASPMPGPLPMTTRTEGDMSFGQKVLKAEFFYRKYEFNTRSTGAKCLPCRHDRGPRLKLCG